LQGGAIGVWVRSPLATAWWGAGLELEPAELASDELRALVGVVALLGEAWGEIFGIVAAAMIDGLVHNAEILALKGDSYRLKDRDLARPPAARTAETA
jgi:hypothetical protein